MNYFSLFTLILIDANTLQRESAPMLNPKPFMDLIVWTFRDARAKSTLPFSSWSVLWWFLNGTQKNKIKHHCFIDTMSLKVEGLFLVTKKYEVLLTSYCIIACHVAIGAYKENCSFTLLPIALVVFLSFFLHISFVNIWINYCSGSFSSPFYESPSLALRYLIEINFSSVCF